MPSNRGPQLFEAVNTRPSTPPRNVYRQVSTDYIFGQVWTRPGLTRRQRRWISLTGVGATGGAVGTTAHIYGALNSGDISLAEMDEFLLHFACYAGWPRTTMLDSVLDSVLERIATERGEEPQPRPFSPLTSEPADSFVEAGARERAAVLGNHGAAGPEQTALSEVFSTGLLYGQVWSRPDLTRSDRRLITLTALAIDKEADLLHAHLAAAVEAGELDAVALREIALHAALYAGSSAGRIIDTVATSVLSAVPA